MASVDSAPSIVLRTLPATPISEIRSSFDNSTAAISAPSILNMAGESHPATPPHSTIQFPQDAPHPSSIKRSSSPTRHSRLSAKPLHLGVRRDVSTMSVDSATSLDTTYHGPVIPPNSDRTYGRTLILAFDGTGDAFDLDNSNVVKLFSVLKKGDNARQLVYYQSGIGTYTIPQVATPLYSKVSKTLDLMFANNLHFHVMSGYQFLMQNYKRNDRICIFGFSRGAYTARALAGMIHKVGLLPAGNEQQVPFAYKMFLRDDELGWKQSILFKQTFSIDVDIEFVGVWDTVASVGLLPTFLPFTKSNTAIKTFRHALSLDEHRTKFKPSLYQRITAAEAERGDFKPPPKTPGRPVELRGRKSKRESKTSQKESKKTTIAATAAATVASSTETNSATTAAVAVTKSEATTSTSRRSASSSLTRIVTGSIKRSARDVRDSLHNAVGRVSSEVNRALDETDDKKEDLSPDSERDRLEQMYLDRSKKTDVLEVWFSGCHCDVGGGSVPNDTPHSLARIPLRWMIRECFLARTGIQFEADRLRELGLDPDTLYPKVSKPPVESFIPSPPATSTPEVAHKESHTKAETKDTKIDPPPETEKAAPTLVHSFAPALGEAKPGMTESEEQHTRVNNISMDGTLVDEADDTKAEIMSNVTEENEPVVDDDEDEKDKKDSASTANEGNLPEEHHNARDRVSPIFDQLKLAKYWWILEFIPLRERVQKADGTFKKKWTINRGRPRVAPQEEPLKVHISVKMRMEDKKLKYKPRVKFTKEPIWVN